MANILNNTREQYGQEVADLLARNPDHLFATAFGYLAMDKIRQNLAQTQAGVQSKQQLAQRSAGVSRPSRTAKAPTGNTQQDIERAAFDFLRGN
jgi:hypothetical protein